MRRLVAQAVRETLLRFHSGATSDSKAQSRESKVEGREPERITAVGQTVEVNPTPEISTTQLPNFPLPSKPISEWPTHPVETRPLPMRFSSAPSTLDPQPSTHPVPLLNVPLRLVGVIDRLYVVLESDRGLVLLDQHAAHERILFEQMLTRLEQQGNASSQRLLLPETVELSVRDAQFLREQLATLTRLGVGLSEFGERTFLLDALPPFVKAPDARRFVLELVDELKSIRCGSANTRWPRPSAVMR